MTAKIGVLEFRSGNAERFTERLRRNGEYTINIGDWIQSVAVQSLLESILVSGDEIVRVDRNTLPSYRGPPVRLVMNACFFEASFPLPNHVTPVFVGFQTSSRDLIRARVAFFRRHQPIGCRDTATADLFREHGVDAYVSGCLTLSLPLRQEQPTTPRTFFVGGESAGEMPSTLDKHVPTHVRENSVSRHQREAVTSIPLRDDDVLMATRTAERLLSTYRTEASLVVTPLLHAAGPCMAMGIPVVLVRRDMRDRFTAIRRLVPVYTPDDFHAIDWNPTCPDLTDLKSCLRSLMADALRGDGPSARDRQFLTSLYEKKVTPTTELLASRGSQDDRPRVARLPFIGKLFCP